MKALKLLAVAAMATLVFAGCQKVTEVDATLETGTANVDVTGKTFERVNTTYITKEVVTAGTLATDPSTTTTTKIAKSVATTTMVFNVDGTYTITYLDAYAATADGDYRELDTATVDTYYSNAKNNDAKIVGLADKPTYRYTETGTYKAFLKVDSADDGNTLDFTLTPTSKVTTNYYYDYVYAAITAASGGSVAQYTYSLYDTTTTTDAIDDSDIDTLRPYYIGLTAANKLIVELNGDTYIEQ